MTQRNAGAEAGRNKPDPARHVGLSRPISNLAALLALGAAPAFAESRGTGGCAGGDWEPALILQRGQHGPAALVQFPESASAIRRLVAAAHEAGDSARVRAGLDRLSAIGSSLSPESIASLARHVPAEELASLRRRFEANRATLGISRVVDSVPAERRLIEGIARDRRTGRLFVTTVVGRELLVLEQGAWRVVAGLDAGSLFGMAADAARRRLWIASGSLEQTPSPETAFRGLIALDLDSLQEIERISLAGPGSPGDLTLAGDGTVYASDPISGALYRARTGDRALGVLVPPGRLRSPQGLALSPDESRLYVADYAYGIGVVDLATGRITRLAGRGAAMLDGVDGLLADRDALIVIQNGTNPRRIARLSLGAGCDEVTGVEILERTNPAWGEPTLGVIDGGELLYVADAQWERYGPAGAIIGEGPTRPTAIRALPLPPTRTGEPRRDFRGQ